MSNQIRDQLNGQYSFDGNWERFCVCGHTLGVHTADSPRACGNYGTGLIDCDCRKFRPTKKKMELTPEEIAVHNKYFQSEPTKGGDHE